MKEREFDHNWSDFYEGLKRNKWAMSYNYSFVVRRFLFVISVYYWYDHVAIQIGVFVLSTEFYAMYLMQSKPFVDHNTNS